MPIAQKSIKEIHATWKEQDAKLLEEIKGSERLFVEQRLALANRRYDLLSHTLNNLLNKLGAQEEDDLG